MPPTKLALLWIVLFLCVSKCPGQQSADANDQQLFTARERMLLERIAQLEQRVAALESRVDGSGAATISSVKPGPQGAGPSSAAQEQALSESSSSSAAPSAGQTNAAAPAPPPLTFAGGTTLNFLIDGYYEYNFNQPIGRANLLRPYDVLSNAFSLNQAAVVVDSPPDTANGKAFGLRLDLQYGQATETLQGNSQNEPRPEIYRNIFQAYGSYVIPVGSGLRIDFGKFASSLGYEGNYTKDQMNYSRAYWFTYLPFYHMGIRANYKVNDKLAVNYWTVNGTQQTEPFNGFKDQYFGVALTPAKTFAWNINYYFGQEHPDVQYFPNGGAPPDAPTIQGVPFEPISNPPKGKLHIFDTYFTWNAAAKVTLVGEADYVVQRLYTSSAPQHTAGGAGYVQYQFTPKFSMAARAEYLSDNGALFSGLNQALKETTVTAKYNAAQGFDVFTEWRIDFSNQPFFYTSNLGVLSKHQNTATLGLVWWLGGKEGAW
ncbi:MAG: outer membrane beta-barrel protein [Acidobacteriaceae bacterium]|nr:outer membrane beta-barrel protein [Acidobacteriaceae bacterium]